MDFIITVFFISFLIGFVTRIIKSRAKRIITLLIIPYLWPYIYTFLLSPSDFGAFWRDGHGAHIVVFLIGIGSVIVASVAYGLSTLVGMGKES